MTYSQSYLDTAHLLNRAGFGGTPDEIAAASEQGLARTTQELIDYDATPDSVDDDAVIEKLKSALPQAAKDLADLRLPLVLVQVWWIYRMLATNRPLQEKMVLFWHNHFTSADFDGHLMLQQNQLYRRHALGNFRTLTLEVSKNPEMLRYLNNAENFKAHPNENYARELMELFTCGRLAPDGKPNYTEDDVKASARAFSGWNFRRGEFFYNPNQHDDGVKTFMGHTGDLNGDDIVDILVSLPATAHAICGKLFRYFAYDDPEPEVMNALVSTYFSSGYDIQAIVTQILTSNAFYSEKARGAVVKSPADLTIGSVRLLKMADEFAPAPDDLFGDDPDAPDLQPTPGKKPRAALRRLGDSPVGRLLFLNNQMRLMGQTILNPPTVKGWDGGKMWINTDTLQARSRFAAILTAMPVFDVEALSSAPAAAPDGDAGFAPERGFGSPAGIGADEAAQIVDTALSHLGLVRIADPIRGAMIDFAQQQRYPKVCARAVLALAMSTPDYQCS